MKGIVVVIFSIVIIGALLLGGCAAPTPAPTPTPAPSPAPAPAPAPLPPIKIGHIRSLTGPTAITNAAMVRGFDVAMDLAKYQAGGRKIEVILEDDAGKAELAVDKARKLIEQDKVAAIVGPTLAGLQMGISTYMNGVGIPNIHSNSSPYGIVAQKHKWTIQAGGTQQQVPSVNGKYAVEKRNIKKISVVGEDTAAGRQYVGAFLEGFKRAGGEIIQEQWVPQGSADYAPYFTAVKPAEACIAWTSGNDSVKFLNQYFEYGMWDKMPLIPAFQGAILEGFILAQLQPKAAEACLGITVAADYTPLFENPGNKKFVEAYKAKHNVNPDTAISNAYNAGLVLLAGLEATKGDTTPQKLMDAMLALNFDGARGGNIRFDKEKKSAFLDVGIMKLQKLDKEYLLSLPIFVYKDVPPEGL